MGRKCHQKAQLTKNYLDINYSRWNYRPDYFHQYVSRRSFDDYILRLVPCSESHGPKMPKRAIFFDFSDLETFVSVSLRICMKIYQVFLSVCHPCVKKVIGGKFQKKQLVLIFLDCRAYVPLKLPSGFVPSGSHSPALSLWNGILINLFDLVLNIEFGQRFEKIEK